MTTEELFTYARTRVLQTPAYRGTPGFSDEVKKISTLSDLIWWLGNTPFPPNHPGETAATSELLTILTTFNPDTLPVLLEYLLKSSSNVSGPSWSSIQAVKDGMIQGNTAEARELAGQTLAWEVKRWRPLLRAEMAGWIARQMEAEP